ncbi:MAG: reverse transcriptase domain-containing protein [Nanoarchaeota archaeon]
MQTYNNLYPKIYSYNNLKLAYKKARKGKSKKDYVTEFESNLDENLLSLQKELINQTYLPKPLKTFIIRDPKLRKISKSEFKDRIVHHALINIIEPIFDNIFIYDSYANRKNKGNSEALLRLQKFIKRISKNNHKKVYFLKADIKHYFENINHEVLTNVIKKKIKDEKILLLIRKIIDNVPARGGANAEWNASW